jgi:hypothetical protein
MALGAANAVVEEAADLDDYLQNGFFGLIG